MRSQPTWRLALCGINHKNTSSDERESLQIGHDRMAEANSVFYNLPGVLESTIVSTCNRIEFYIVSERQYVPCEIVKLFYKEFNNTDISKLADKFYNKKGKHVADHLFAVTSGMDSMVLGEDQIIGQVKDAYTSSCRVKTAAKILHRLFHQAFRAGKQVRSETDIAKGACSISAAAVGMVKNIINIEERPTILFIGMNKMIKLATSIIDRTHHGQFIFANRTPTNIKTIAAKYDADYHSLDELPRLLVKADIVFSCTGSENPIVTKKIIDEAVSLNKDKLNNKKLIFVDMAIPRDIEFNTGYHNSIHVYGLDDINDFIKDRQSKQKLAIPEAKEIIDQLLGEFKYWYNHVRYEPLYNGLGRTFKAIKKEELDDMLAQLPTEISKKFNKATNRMIDRMLQAKVQTSQVDQKG